MYAALDHVRSSEYCREGLASRSARCQLHRRGSSARWRAGTAPAGDYDQGIKAAQAR